MTPLGFRAVALPSSDWQKHHLIPLRLFRKGPVASFLTDLRGHGVRANDFTRNGLFLPKSEDAARVSALPLHRGPHRLYTELVAHRLADIVRGRGVKGEAAWRIVLLQRGLKRVLAQARLATPLNRFDPMMQAQDFTAIDALIDQLWLGSGCIESAVEV